MMDERTRNRFTAGLPTPNLNELQDRLAADIGRLEELAESRSAREADIGAEIWHACASLADAMSVAALPRTADGDILPAYDYDDREAERTYEAARAPFDAAEDWILRKGAGTGSARVLAICYLGALLGLRMNWKEVYGGTLDNDRSSMVTNMARSPNPARLPSGFWRIFVGYRNTTAQEWESQGSARALVAAK